MTINEVVQRTDYSMLRIQKSTLLDVIAGSRHVDSVQRTIDLTGILHLLDAFQDAAAEVLGERHVFGEPEVG